LPIPSTSCLVEDEIFDLLAGQIERAISGDGIVNFLDYAMFAANWLEEL
jgi:hypothetical protein